MQSENSPYHDQAQQYIFQNLLKTPATAFPMYYKDTHNYVDQSGILSNHNQETVLLQAMINISIRGLF